MTTAELDAIAEAVMASHGARSAPQAVYRFPGATCISVNDEAVHGIPGPRVLQPGDVVKLDVTVELDGYVADAAKTVVLPPVSTRSAASRPAPKQRWKRASRPPTPGNPSTRLAGPSRPRSKAEDFESCASFSATASDGPSTKNPA